MKNILLIAVLNIICWKLSLTLKPRIAQGSFVNIEDYPYQANLIDYGSDERTYKEPICGASIISSQWLVTAGHCLVDKPKEELKVRTGATYRYNDGKEHEIDEMIIHPDFERYYYTISNDIALIKLTEPIEVNSVQKPILLPTSFDKPVPGKKLTITGFGREGMNDDGKTPQLKVAKLTIVSLGKCRELYYFDPVTDNVLCAGTDAASTCNGDSGGPAVMHGRLAGIVSSGFLCSTIDIPATFTNINKYINWILKYVKI
ncbi:trypsin-like [Phymastichus coffea]|uniref:trypsin-like n=1 Tax=Phymastichus coffea TaxID=108790 RepID=UPI00273CDA90|nr:trypsin-like [Phymastichus coffea]